MTKKSEMQAAMAKAQEHITLALAELANADDEGRSQPMQSDHQFFDGLQTQDALIQMRAAYHALAGHLYPESDQ